MPVRVSRQCHRSPGLSLISHCVNDPMDANSLTSLLCMVPLWAISCSAHHRAEVPAPHHRAEVPAPEQQVSSPTPTRHRQCPIDQRSPFCITLIGTAYRWDASRGCKKLVHGNDDGPYDCMTACSPDFPDAWLDTEDTETCYERAQTDTIRDLLLSKTRHARVLTERAGWKICSPDISRWVEHAPHCP